MFFTLLLLPLRVFSPLNDARGLQVFERDVRRLINADSFKADAHAQTHIITLHSNVFQDVQISDALITPFLKRLPLARQAEPHGHDG